MEVAVRRTEPQGIIRNVLYDLADYEGFVKDESENYVRLGCTRRPYKHVADTSSDQDDRSLNLLCLRTSKNFLSTLSLGIAALTARLSEDESVQAMAKYPSGILATITAAGGKYAAVPYIFHNLLLYRDNKDIFVIDPTGSLTGEPTHPLTTELQSIDPEYHIHPTYVPIISAGGDARCGKISAACADRVECLANSEIAINGRVSKFSDLESDEKRELIKAYLGVYIESPERMSKFFAESIPDEIKQATVNGKSISSLYTRERPIFTVEVKSDGRPWFSNSLTVSHTEPYQRPNGKFYDPTLPYLEDFHSGTHSTRSKQETTVVPVSREQAAAIERYADEIPSQTIAQFREKQGIASSRPRAANVGSATARRAGKTVGPACAIL